MSELVDKVAKHLGVRKKDIKTMENFTSLTELGDLQHGTVIMDVVNKGTIVVSVNEDKEIEGIEPADEESDIPNYPV